MHVVQRGINRNRCFVGLPSYRLYLSLLEEAALEYECDVHAYVLMTNHVHLLLTPRREQSVSLLMKSVGQQYVQAMNRERSRVGTLWQGRYYSCLVDSVGYLLRCQRYIELNPVRAGMVEWPEQYIWSSYRTNALGEGSSLLTPHRAYLRLADDEEPRRTAYRRLFGEIPREEVDEVRHALKSGLPFGGNEFVERLCKLGEVRAGHRGRPRQESAVSREAFRQVGKGV